MKKPILLFALILVLATFPTIAQNPNYKPAYHITLNEENIASCEGMASLNHSEVFNYAIRNTRTGGSISISSGIYTNLTLLPLYNVDFYGTGWQTILQLADGFRVNSNVTVRNLVITSNGNDVCPIAIYAGYPWKIYNVHLENLKLIGPSVNKPSGRATIAIKNAVNVWITNCDISGGAHNGILFNDNMLNNDYSKNVWITSCYIHDNFDDAIDPNSDSNLHIEGNIISNNQFYATSFEYNCSDSTFIGNTVTGGLGVCIHNSTGIIATNNTFRNVRTVYKIVNSTNYIIDNNIITP